MWVFPHHELLCIPPNNKIILLLAEISEAIKQNKLSIIYETTAIGKHTTGTVTHLLFHGAHTHIRTNINMFNWLGQTIQSKPVEERFLFTNCTWTLGVQFQWNKLRHIELNLSKNTNSTWSTDLCANYKTKISMKYQRGSIWQGDTSCVFISHTRTS